MQSIHSFGNTGRRVTKGNDRATRGWLANMRHAFAVEADGAVAPHTAERQRIEHILERIVKREMAGPAILFLESWKPLGAITGQSMHTLTPFVGVVMEPDAWEGLARYMEKRGAIPWMVQRLEELQSAAQPPTQP